MVSVPSSPADKVGGNGEKVFQCVSCGGLITYSDRLVPIRGTNRHCCVNTGGLECDFQTFTACPGAVALGDTTDENTWFSGYKWRPAFCRYCGQHLGWYYQVTSMSDGPAAFWGILVNTTVSD